VVFPGGFGTLDELMEMLTLTQTGKLGRKILIILYGSDYWRELIDFDVLVRHGMIDRADLELFHYADDPEAAFTLLAHNLPCGLEQGSPAFARSEASDSTIAPPAEEEG
jgi:predicted Rossmann-fold nucleotide-binding protein